MLLESSSGGVTEVIDLRQVQQASIACFSLLLLQHCGELWGWKFTRTVLMRTIYTCGQQRHTHTHTHTHTHELAHTHSSLSGQGSGRLSGALR